MRKRRLGKQMIEGVGAAAESASFAPKRLLVPFKRVAGLIPAAWRLSTVFSESIGYCPSRLLRGALAFETHRERLLPHCTAVRTVPGHRQLSQLGYQSPGLAL